MRRAPNTADLLSPVPRGRVRVFFKSSISTSGDGNAVRVTYKNARGNCYDCKPEWAQGYIKDGLAAEFDPNAAVVKFMKAAGVSGIQVAHKHSAAFLAAAKKAGIAQISAASSG